MKCEKKVNKSENRNDKASQEKYRNIPVKRVGGEKDGKNKGDRDRATDDDGVTCDEKRNCDDSPKHRPGSGEQHRGERGTGKSHQCPECEYSCVKLSNMKRHMKRHINILRLSGRERSKVGSVYVLSVAESQMTHNISLS